MRAQRVIVTQIDTADEIQRYPPFRLAMINDHRKYRGKPSSTSIPGIALVPDPPLPDLHHVTQQLKRYAWIGRRFVLDQRIDEGGFAIHHTHAIEPVGLVLLQFPVHERAGD